jgi:hypothetical protein
MEFTGNGLAALVQLPSLEELRIEQCMSFTDRCMPNLASLKRLKKLTLVDTALHGEGLAFLSGCQSLEYIELRGQCLSTGLVAGVRPLPSNVEVAIWAQGSDFVKNGCPPLESNAEIHVFR